MTKKIIRGPLSIHYICSEITDGSWGSWSSEDTCTKKEFGNQTRVRKCDRPKPADGGRICPGSAKEQLLCHYGK